GQMLRAAGLGVTVSEIMDAVRALAVIDLMDKDEVHRALRTVLATRIEEFPPFDRCFDAFWKFHAEEGQGLDGLVAAAPGTKPEDQEMPGYVNVAQEKQAMVALEGWEEEAADDGEPLEVPGMSDREALMDQDFSTFPAEDLDEVARLTALIARRLARRVSRRPRPAPPARVPDFRRSMAPP